MNQTHDLTDMSPTEIPSNRQRLQRLCEIVEVILRPAHLRRTVLTAALVGSWLTFFNLGDVLASGSLTWPLALKIVLNFATPFVVANVGLLSRASH